MSLVLDNTASGREPGRATATPTMNTIDVDDKTYHPLMEFPSHVLLATNKSMPFDRFIRAVARREAPTLMNPESDLAKDIMALATDRAEKLREFFLQKKKLTN